MPNLNESGTVALNNYLQSKGLVAALSWQESLSGPKSAPTWTCVCKISGQVFGTGEGSLKRTARDIAAKQALKSLTEESA
ncbi:hypothetical protein GGX14DRAFT_460665 [Mycena pura]|uniref:DRBM domain-containing protein n=1 Tax=Mycena pura TaxID=153505 RepID=A0AAD6VB07_9AGAR|nr:hypothetical protein GGX14DRAFT_460665 [Mycena pura]